MKNFFSTAKEHFNTGRSKGGSIRNRDSSEIVKIVEPNFGRVVTFEINADEPFLHMYVGQIVAMGKVIDAETTISEKKVTLQCQDADSAETLRKSWEKRVV